MYRHIISNTTSGNPSSLCLQTGKMVACAGKQTWPDQAHARTMYASGAEMSPPQHTYCALAYPTSSGEVSTSRQNSSVFCTMRPQMWKSMVVTMRCTVLVFEHVLVHETCLRRSCAR